MGSLGLIAFACVVWKFLLNHNAGGAVIAGATVVWAIVSTTIWWVWKKPSTAAVRMRRVCCGAREPDRAGYHLFAFCEMERGRPRPHVQAPSARSMG
jgi:hypothetical protein